MCDFHAAGSACDRSLSDSEPPPDGTEPGRTLSRRHLLGAAGVSAAALTAGGLIGRAPTARAATGSAAPAGSLSVTLLGTSGGPQPIASRFGTSSVLVVNGRSYLIDCGRGSVSQFLRAGLDLAALDGIFLTHLHSDHTCDYFSYPLLAATVPAAFSPLSVYGPGPSGEDSAVPTAPGPVPGTAAMTRLANDAFAASSDFFMTEHIGVDPASLVSVHEVMPLAGVGASLSTPAPAMRPFTVMETSDMKVSAVLVPHGKVFPAYAYRFDTDQGSVVFSGDTAPTPNIPMLAKDAGLLVHEVVDLAVFSGLGLPAALIDHLATVHTDVSLLGQIAAESGVPALVTTHLGPGDPSIVTDASWRALLRASARKADYHGQLILGQDLMRIPVTRR